MTDILVLQQGRELAALDVLDAGCGTGLCGASISGMSRCLVGVDLSEDMLAEARKRGVYDDIILSEITEYMTSHLRAFDLIVSADTLCYFGKLDEVLQAAYGCLRDSGIMIFTVELEPACEEIETYRIRFGATPNYRAARAYAAMQVLEAAAKHAESFDPQKLRDALSSIRVDTVMGPWEVDDTGFMSIEPTIVQIQKGQRVIVWPSNLAESRFLPMPKWKDRVSR